MRQTSLAGMAAVLFVLPVHSAEYGQQESTPLTFLDGAFIAAHEAANKLDLETGGPVILLRDGQLILIHKRTESAAQVILSDYAVFKTFAHIPVAIYLLLEPQGAGAIDARRLEQLRKYRTKLDNVEHHFEQIGLSGVNLERQKRILAESKQFLEKAIERQSFSTAELHCFTQCMLPQMKANIACAAASQLDTMHVQMMAWKQVITPVEWKQLRVAVKGAVLARKDSLAKQYFERLLHLKGEGIRLTYMELYFPPTPM